MSRTLIAVFAVQLLALGALAQNATEPSTIEFGRASSGTIHAITKAPKQFSGTLGLSWSSGSLRGEGYDGTLGGELVNDRLWFFGSASRAPRMQLAPTSFLSLRSTSAPSDRMTLDFSYSRDR